LEDGHELVCHLQLILLHLLADNLVLPEIKYLFAEQEEDFEHVLALSLTLLGDTANFRNKTGPASGPLLFYD